MPTKPLNLKPTSSIINEKTIRETLLEESKSVTPKTNRYSNSVSTASAAEKLIIQRENFEIMAKEFAKEKTDNFSLENSDPTNRQHPYETQTDRKSTEYVRHLNIKEPENNAIKPIVRPGIVLSEDLEKRINDILESIREAC
jgi:hypothetical protein